jgi:hypothetical protein
MPVVRAPGTTPRQWRARPQTTNSDPVRAAPLATSSAEQRKLARGVDADLRDRLRSARRVARDGTELYQFVRYRERKDLPSDANCAITRDIPSQAGEAASRDAATSHGEGASADLRAQAGASAETGAASGQ